MSTAMCAVVLSHITIGAGTISLNSGMQGCLIRGVLTVTGGTVSMTSKLDGRFTYCGAQIVTFLYRAYRGE